LTSDIADGFVELHEAELASMSSDQTIRDGETQKTEHFIIDNVAEDMADQINGPVGDKSSIGMSRIIARGNIARGTSMQINNSVCASSFSELLRSRERKRQ
jgi:hypothetical protein